MPTCAADAAAVSRINEEQGRATPSSQVSGPTRIADRSKTESRLSSENRITSFATSAVTQGPVLNSDVVYGVQHPKAG
jgi:hypothetical protein